MKVLLIRLSALGDVCHALPVPGAVKKLLPDARVWWAVEAAAAPILSVHPGLDGVITVPRRRLARLLRHPDRWGDFRRELKRLGRELASWKFDIAIDLHGNVRSALVAWATKAPVRIGSDRAREGASLAYTRRVRQSARAHKVDRAFGLLTPLAADGILPAPSWPALDFPEESRRNARELRAQDSIVLHPGVSRFGAFKAWPLDRWLALASEMRTDGRRMLVTAGPGEETAAASVAEAAAGELVKTDLLGLAAVLGSARAVIACDSGPLHLAAALGAPVVGLYGPKDPAVYGPRGPAATAVVRNAIPCSPCDRRRCPVPLCMRRLEVERVRAALDAVLAGRGYAPPPAAWDRNARWFRWPAPVGDLARWWWRE